MTTKELDLAREIADLKAQLKAVAETQLNLINLTNERISNIIEFIDAISVKPKKWWHF